MRTVILYKSTKELVRTSRDYIEIYSFGKPVASCNNGSIDMFDEHEINVDGLPIQHFFWRSEGQTRDVYAAFDRDLRELINIQIDEAVETLESRCQKYLNLIATQRDEILFLQSRSVWDTIVSKIKTWWNK